MMGRCLVAGWSEKQFWFSTYRAVHNLISAQQEREDFEMRLSWEQTKMICDFLEAPYKKAYDDRDSIVLPWRKQEPADVEVLSEEDKKKLFAKRDRKIQKKLMNGKG